MPVKLTLTLTLALTLALTLTLTLALTLACGVDARQVEGELRHWTPHPHDSALLAEDVPHLYASHEICMHIGYGPAWWCTACGGCAAPSCDCLYVCISYVCISYVCISYVCISYVCISYVCISYVCISYVPHSLVIAKARRELERRERQVEVLSKGANLGE